MSPSAQAWLTSWRFDPWIVVPLAVTAGLYLRGWLDLCCRAPHRFDAARLAWFLGGLAVVLVALTSPIEAFAGLLLQAHMAQHLLLMMAAPPMLWLGAPLLPLLRGLPEPIRRVWVAPLFRSPAVRSTLRWLTGLGPALAIYSLATWTWHVPALYEAAIRQPALHALEHACFLGAGLLFWLPVVRPYPYRPAFSLWLLIPYLLLADLQNTVLAAILAFSNRVLYPHYASMPRLWGWSALDDQAAAGVLMWVPGSAVYLLPVALLASNLLFGKKSARRSEPRRIPLAVVPGGSEPASGDLLRLPLVGPFLRWRHARLALQLPMLALAVAVVLDGFLGPPVAGMNLAGILPWIHWRGLLVVALLTVGNLFCLACPFLLPRELSRRWLSARLAWPRPLRSKWLAVGLLAGFFWAYEVFSLWDWPWATAWIVVGYFAAAFAVDGFFRGASFCKYVCPIGQFNFVQSLASPFELRVKDAAVCKSCRTKDCIRGGPGGRGCETGLYLPRKRGNLDCTFCLDCVHACPVGNVGVLPRLPAGEIVDDGHRSGVGRLSQRVDLAALVLVLVAAAFVNAAGMVAPVLAWQDQATAALGLASPILVTSACLLAGLIVLPALAVGLVGSLAHWLAGLTRSPWHTDILPFVHTLAPLGFGMWLAHYSFHFLTTGASIVPVAQRVANDLGWTWLGSPHWAACCCADVAPRLLRLEILLLDLGLLATLLAAHRLACRLAPERSLALFAPWAVLAIAAFTFGVWILFQPMEMRGALPG
jgi:cytochrome c oxidase assembly factor CtaG/ferredoxin